MNNIDRLIAELCPKGVEHLAIGEFCVLRRGESVTKNSTNPGPIPVIAGGQQPAYFIDKANRSGETIVVSSSGAYAGFVSYWDIPIFVSDAFSIEAKSDFCLKYLYYVLKNRQESIHSLKKGGGVPHVHVSDLAPMIIPLPPLPVQEEIVRILDTFSSTVAELEQKLNAERAARIRQYEHYRDFLLTFNETAGQLLTDKQVRWVTLGEIATKISTGGTPNTQNSSFYDGTIPWLRTQEVNWLDIYDTGIKITDEGFNDSSANWIPMNCVIVAMYGATAAKVAINKISLTTNQACCNIQVDETKALYRYVFYWLCKEYETLRAKGQGSQSNINSLIVKNHPIPLPSLEEQSRIVEILDRFDTLVNDLKTGLPAEIALRRKQYEHYRDTLLTFTQTN